MLGGLGNKLKINNWKPYYWVYIFCSFFLVGIVIGSKVTVDLFFIYLLILFSFLYLFLLSPSLAVKIFLIALVGASVGVGRWQLSWPVLSEKRVEWYNGQEVEIEGVVSAEPQQRLQKQKITLSVQKVNQNPAQGKVLLTLPLYPSYAYGDVLLVQGKVKPVPRFDDFAYDKYLSLFGIYSVAYYPQVSKIGFDPPNLALARLLQLKTAVINRVNILVAEPYAAFLGGLLWGAKRSIDPQVMENFNITGTTHIVALSGYNIMILFVMVMLAMPWLGVSRKYAYIVVIAVIIFFVVITGMSASVVRAALMSILVIVAYNSGGGVRTSVILLIAAAIMCLANPKVLLYDAGFQLSFLATAGLIYLAPHLQPYFNWLPKIFSLQEAVVTTLSAIFMTAPLIVYQFGRFSLVALPANLLILFVIPAIMAIGFAAVVISFIYFPLGQVIGWLAQVLLSYPLWVTEKLAAFPLASILVDRLPLAAIVIWYVAVFLFLIKVNWIKWPYARKC